MRMDRCLRSALMFVALLATSGCGMTKAYEGSSRGRGDVSVIQPAEMFDSKASIVRVDTTAEGFFDNKMEVLAGRHVVTLSMSIGNNLTAQGDVVFEAKGGRVYETHGGTTGFIPQQYWFWITDAADHSVVGGKAPPK